MSKPLPAHEITCASPGGGSDDSDVLGVAGVMENPRAVQLHYYNKKNMIIYYHHQLTKIIM